MEGGVTRYTPRRYTQVDVNSKMDENERESEEIELRKKRHRE